MQPSEVLIRLDLEVSILNRRDVAENIQGPKTGIILSERRKVNGRSIWIPVMHAKEKSRNNVANQSNFMSPD